MGQMSVQSPTGGSAVLNPSPTLNQLLTNTHPSQCAQPPLPNNGDKRPCDAAGGSNPLNTVNSDITCSPAMTNSENNLHNENALAAQQVRHTCRTWPTPWIGKLNQLFPISDQLRIQYSNRTGSRHEQLIYAIAFSECDQRLFFARRRIQLEHFWSIRNESTANESPDQLSAPPPDDGAAHVPSPVYGTGTTSTSTYDAPTCTDATWRYTI